MPVRPKHFPGPDGIQRDYAGAGVNTTDRLQVLLGSVKVKTREGLMPVQLANRGVVCEHYRSTRLLPMKIADGQRRGEQIRQLVVRLPVVRLGVASA